MKRVGLLLMLALCVPAAASAAPFTWVFEGTIGALNAGATVPLGGLPFSANDAFTLTLTQESTSPDSSTGSPTCGVYAPVTASSLTVGATTLSGTSGQYSLHTSAYSSPAPLNCITTPSGANIGSLQLPLSGNYGVFLTFTGTYPTDALVTDLSNFNVASFDIYYASQANAVAFPRVTSKRVATTVPEPATAGLIGFGVLAAIRRRR